MNSTDQTSVAVVDNNLELETKNSLVAPSAEQSGSYQKASASVDFPLITKG